MLVPPLLNIPSLPAPPPDDKNTNKDPEIPPAYSTMDLVNEEKEQEDDPWDLPELADTGVKWSGEAAGPLHPHTAQRADTFSGEPHPDSALCLSSLQSWTQKERL